MITENITYFLYARKSSESEDRQMASIDDQVQVIEKLALDKGITITKVFQESKSAKAPGRPVFNEMLTQIEKGEAQGIICWKLNRLSRNPIDGGRISWLLQNSVIKHIQCNSSSYKPSDNVLMMSVELGMANQFIKDLKTDVRRGTKAKANRGWFPGSLPPVGYLHNKKGRSVVKDQEIIIDPETYNTVKTLWHHMKTGNYSLQQIKKVGDSLGLKSPRGGFYSRSAYNRLFRNPFYYGKFKWKNEHGVCEIFKGKHKPMISHQTFLKVQKVLDDNRTKSHPLELDFKYRGWLRCGECKSMITAERKSQVRCTGCRYKFSDLKKNACPKCALKISKMKQPNFIRKIYYHCTKHKPCSQGSIEESTLTHQYLDYIDKYQIPHAFYSFIMGCIDHLKSQDKTDSEHLLKEVNKRRLALNKRLDKLLILRTDEEISKDIFIKSSREIEKQIEELNLEYIKSQSQQKKIEKELLQYVDLKEKAKKILESSDKTRIKKLLQPLSSNQTILSKSLYITRSKPLLALKECEEYFNAQNRGFEPENRLIKQGDLKELDIHYPHWRTRVRTLRDSILSYTSIY